MSDKLIEIAKQNNALVWESLLQGVVIKLTTDELRATIEQVCAPMVEALSKIDNWVDFPDTGEIWEQTGQPMSYSACYGSNGERDYMRGIAATAISNYRTIMGDKE